jgi:hypothetical protein
MLTSKTSAFLRSASFGPVPIAIFLALSASTSWGQLIDPFPEGPPPPVELDGAATAASGAFSPISGNPVSQFYLMTNNSFETAVGLDDPDRGELPIFGAGVEFGAFNTDGTRSRSYILPLRRSFLLDMPGWAINLDLPLAFTTIEGSESYSGSGSVGLRIPVFVDRWTLTPAFRIGFLSSNALSTGAVTYGGTITSELDFQLGDTEFTVGNLVSRFHAIDASALQDDTVDVDLKNTVLRNGVIVTHPVSAFSQDLDLSAFVTDTRFFGDEVFIDQYNEVGFTIGWNEPSLTAITNRLAIGVTYTRNEEGDGIRANFGFRF